MIALRICVLAGVLGCVLLPVAATAAAPVNALVSSGAEDSLPPGWSGAGWVSDSYGALGRPSAADMAAGGYGDGQRLFAATGPSAAISQTILLGPAEVARVDAGVGYIGYGGAFGAQGSTSDTSRLSVQPLDAQGAPLRLPHVIAGPTAADRANQTTLLSCAGGMLVPVGTRQVTVTLIGEGLTAMADALYVHLNSGPPAGVGGSGPTAEGVGCSLRSGAASETGVLPAPLAPAMPLTPAAGPLTAKLSIARARIVRRGRVLDVLAPITSLASGSARVQLYAAGLVHSFSAPVNSRDARLRFRRLIPRAQAQLGTGIVTITHGGDADTRPQTVRLRAASRAAELRMTRPTISAGRLTASGAVSKRARGVVRLQIEYVHAGKTSTRQFKVPIVNGNWSLSERLTQTFTGYYPERIRGEMRSYHILGSR